MTNSQPFKPVYEFCGEDAELYREILEELEISIRDLAKKMESDEPELESLKFMAHKMKSSFRILKDEDFKLLLDGYVEHVEGKNTNGINKSAGLITATCESYLELLKIELDKKA